VIIDSDIAELYQVNTRDINKDEKKELVENFHRFNGLKHSTALPKAFTERGLYMLATILKSSKATETTLAIIDTFAKVREISRTIKEIPKTPQNTPKYQQLRISPARHPESGVAA